MKIESLFDLFVKCFWTGYLHGIVTGLLLGFGIFAVYIIIKEFKKI